MTRSAPSRTFADEILVASLAGGATIEAAARDAEVSVSTVKRRLRSPAFVARVDAARGDIVGRTLDMLTVGAAEAAVVLRGIVLDRQPEHGPSPAQAPGASVRVSAAKALLASVLQHRDQQELAERVDQLERLAASNSTALRSVR